MHRVAAFAALLATLAGCAQAAQEMSSSVILFYSEWLG